jgi:hypothetical protein
MGGEGGEGGGRVFTRRRLGVRNNNCGRIIFRRRGQEARDSKWEKFMRGVYRESVQEKNTGKL